MSTLVKTEWIEQASPSTRARITGVVYLLFFLTAALSALVMPAISGLGGMSSDAVAIANSVLAHQASYELSYALSLISTACYVALAALFYGLFRPVSKTLSLLAACFSLVGCAVTAYGSIFQLAPLAVLGGSSYLSVFNVKHC